MEGANARSIGICRCSAGVAGLAGPGVEGASCAGESGVDGQAGAV
jgi:hypothetical protein